MKYLLLGSKKSDINLRHADQLGLAFDSVEQAMDWGDRHCTTGPYRTLLVTDDPEGADNYTVWAMGRVCYGSVLWIQPYKYLRYEADGGVSRKG